MVSLESCIWVVQIYSSVRVQWISQVTRNYLQESAFIVFLFEPCRFKTEFTDLKHNFSKFFTDRQVGVERTFGVVLERWSRGNLEGIFLISFPCISLNLICVTFKRQGRVNTNLFDKFAWPTLTHLNNFLDEASFIDEFLSQDTMWSATVCPRSREDGEKCVCC